MFLEKYIHTINNIKYSEDLINIVKILYKYYSFFKQNKIL